MFQGIPGGGQDTGRAAVAHYLGEKRIGIGVANLSRTRLPIHLNQLVPGGQYADLGAPEHPHPGLPYRRQACHLQDTQAGSRRHQEIALPAFRASGRDIGSRRNRSKHCNFILGQPFRMLNHDDGVRALGGRRARHDLNGLA